MQKKLIFLIFIFSVLFSQTPNLLKNGSFEQGVNEKGIPKYWGDANYQQALIKKGYADATCLMISSTNYTYAIGAQIVPLALKEGTRLTLMGYIKGEAIEPEKEKWQGAKVQVIFLDSKNKELGEPIDVILAKTGTFDWDMFIQNIDVPSGVNGVKILLGLWGARGTVWFDDFQLYPVLSDQEKKDNNLLDNGDFEIWGKWELLGEGQVEIKYPGYKGSSQALYVKNPKPAWAFAAQKISLKNVQNEILTLSGMVKCTDIVAGKKKWEKGRIYAEFYDKRGKRIGDWEEILALEKTTNWIPFIKKIKVPAEAQSLKLFFGIQNAQGEIVFDDLVLKKE